MTSAGANTWSVPLELNNLESLIYSNPSGAVLSISAGNPNVTITGTSTNPIISGTLVNLTSNVATSNFALSGNTGGNPSFVIGGGEEFKVITTDLTPHILVSGAVSGGVQLGNPAGYGGYKVTAPTVANSSTNDTQVATTAFVQSAISSGTSDVNSITSNVSGFTFSPSTGNVVMSGTLAVANGGTGVTTKTGTGSVVLSADPTLTGVPLAPTATLGTNTTQLATTAFVQSAITAIPAGVSSFSGSTTGLTPAVATTGAITLDGTLAVAHGGTGVTTATGYLYGNGTSAVTSSTTIPTTALSGTITNAQLANSTISGVALGGNLANLTIGSGLTGTSSTYNGSTADTISIPASGVTAGSYNTANITVNSQGIITSASTGAGGVTSFSAGTTGLTPNTATGGAITLGGTLAVANGGTGVTTSTGYLYGNGTSATTSSTTIPSSAISGTITAQQVQVTAQTGNVTYYPSFVSGDTTGSYGSQVDGNGNLSYNPSTGALTTKSVAFTTGQSLGASSSATMKNRLINGNMNIDQRNVGGVYTNLASPQYCLDRWYYRSTSATPTFTVQQNAGSITPPAGFINYLGYTATNSYTPSSTDRFALGQPIEYYNTYDLAWGTASAKSATLSFWVRSSLTGTFGGAIQNGGENYSCPFSYTISSANTWTYCSAVIPPPTAGTWGGSGISGGVDVGIYVFFSIGAGSSNQGTAGVWSASTLWSATGATNITATNGATLYLTGVQLEQGSVPTSFDYRSYDTELRMCQRYYENSFFAYGVAPANGSSATTFAIGGNCCLYAVTYWGNVVLGSAYLPYKTVKRITGTVKQYGNSLAELGCLSNTITPPSSATAYTFLANTSLYGQDANNMAISNQDVGTPLWGVFGGWTCEAEL